MADDIQIISRPKAPAAGDDVQIISRPKQPEPDTFAGRTAANFSAGRAESQEGMEALLGRPSSPWERVKGAGKAMLGGAEMAGAIPAAAGRTVVGAPIEGALKDAGAPPWASKLVADTADLGSQVLAGGAAKQLPGMVRAIPQTTEEIMALLRGAAQKAPGMVNEAAPVIGNAARRVVDATEATAGELAKAGQSAGDIATNMRKRALEKKAAKAADAAPTRDVLKVAGGGEFQAAKELGGDIKPEVVQGRIGSLRKHVIDNDVELSAEKTYPIARDMLEYLERRQEDISSFKDLMALQREGANFVKRAKKAAETTGDDSDYRASAIAMKNLDEFVSGLTKSDMVGASGDPEAANIALEKGKELWRRNGKLAIVEDIIKKAIRRNDPASLKTKFANIAEDDFAYERFSPAEQKLIDDIASETPKTDAATGFVPSAVRKIGSAAAGNNTLRMKRAKELLDMIARGEAAQADAAATAAKNPGIMDRPGRGLGPAR